MNNQSPLIPQGSLLQQPNKGRARVKIAVFLVLAIHGIGLMALLMQGCKKEPDPGNANALASNEATNSPGPTFIEPTNPPAATNVSAIPQAVETPPAAPPSPPAVASDY